MERNGNLNICLIKTLEKYRDIIFKLYCNIICTTILILFILFVYYLCHYKQIQNNIIFTLFRKRLQLIITMLLSYNCLISFIIYCINCQIINVPFIIIICLIIGLVPLLIFFKYHRYFTLSIHYYKSIFVYWFLKIIDWDQTFILFASKIYDYGKDYIVWDQNWDKLTNKKKKKKRKCDPNRYYYFYFKSMHSLIKMIFLSISMLFYSIEVIFKLILLFIYINLRFIHYWIIMYLMYYGKLGQFQLFIQHYSRYCVGINAETSTE